MSVEFQFWDGSFLSEASKAYEQKANPLHQQYTELEMLAKAGKLCRNIRFTMLVAVT